VLVVNYGGGTNSTALLVEAERRGVRPDLIVFADTGSERPETYAYLDYMDRWLASVGFPTIERVRWVRKDGTFLPLHEWCEKFASLPSKAFGLPGCTVKWKQQPADKYIAQHAGVRSAWAQGRAVERWIGYDADEPQRHERMQAARMDDTKWVWRSPLIEWDMGREECVAALRSAGLRLPGKSACWLCPSMKKHEIDALSEDHPSLLQRALAIEAAADVDRSKVAGLGRRLNWAEYLKQPKLFASVRAPEEACGCFDG
jgi:hypothetical protein